MAINKVVYGGRTLIDISNDTADAAHVAAGYTVHTSNGEQVSGTAAVVYNSANEELTLPDWAVRLE